MSNAFASHFERIGMTADEARSRAALFQELEDRGGTVLNGRPQWYRFSPGRIEIFGKHTDYAGGHSLLAAVPRGIALVARPRTDGVVRVGDVRDGQVVDYPSEAVLTPGALGCFDDNGVTVVADLPKRVDWDQALIAGVVERIRAAGDDPTQYVDIAIKVPERKYTAWPESIRTAFAPARTVRTGKPSFVLTLKEHL